MLWFLKDCHLYPWISLSTLPISTPWANPLEVPGEDALAGHVKSIATRWKAAKVWETLVTEGLGSNPLSLQMIEMDTKDGFLAGKGNINVPIQ